MPQFIDNNEAGKATFIQEQGGLEKTVHVFESRDIDAVNGALAARRPLLVRGEPGVGKSQLARAAAQLLKRAFVSFTVDNRTESHELMWHFDAVARLAEAQIQGVLPGVKDDRAMRTNLHMSRFITPGPLWWAMSWSSAEKQLKCSFGNCSEYCEDAELAKTGECRGTPLAMNGGVAGGCLIHKPEGWVAADGVVVLIDEIDKADASVPNGLLECLGQHSFTCSDGTRVASENGATPLVVVTTNEERALPDPFLRRCVVLQLALPALRADDRKPFVDRLVLLGKEHDQAYRKEHTKAQPLAKEVLRDAAEMLAADRLEISDRGLAPPGCAEYLDLLAALRELSGKNNARPAEMLGRLREFVYQKHPTGEG